MSAAFAAHHLNDDTWYFHENLIKLIQKKAKVGTLAGTQQFLPDLVALLEENKKFKQQLKIAEMEKNF